MSLRSQFNSNPVLSNDGVWIDFDQYPNNDGTIPGFKIARASGQNKRWSAFITEFTEPYIDEEGMPDYGRFGEDIVDVNRRRTNESFKAAILLDWRNFELNEEGKKTKFSKKALETFVDSGEWGDLIGLLILKANEASHFQSKAGKASVKN